MDRLDQSIIMPGGQATPLGHLQVQEAQEAQGFARLEEKTFPPELGSE